MAVATGSNFRFGEVIHCHNNIYVDFRKRSSYVDYDPVEESSKFLLLYRSHSSALWPTALSTNSTPSVPVVNIFSYIEIFTHFFTVISISRYLLSCHQKAAVWFSLLVGIAGFLFCTVLSSFSRTPLSSVIESYCALYDFNAGVPDQCISKLISILIVSNCFSSGYKGCSLERFANCQFLSATTVVRTASTLPSTFFSSTFRQCFEQDHLVTHPHYDDFRSSVLYQSHIYVSIRST